MSHAELFNRHRVIVNPIALGAAPFALRETDSNTRWFALGDK